MDKPLQFVMVDPAKPQRKKITASFAGCVLIYGTDELGANMVRKARTEGGEIRFDTAGKEMMWNPQQASFIIIEDIDYAGTDNPLSLLGLGGLTPPGSST